MVASAHSVQMSHIKFDEEYNVIFYNIVLIHDKILTKLLLNSEFLHKDLADIISKQKEMYSYLNKYNLHVQVQYVMTHWKFLLKW